MSDPDKTPPRGTVMVPTLAALAAVELGKATAALRDEVMHPLAVAAGLIAQARESGELGHLAEAETQLALAGDACHRVRHTVSKAREMTTTKGST